jgi:hypothetical protein
MLKDNPRYVWWNARLDTIHMPDYALRHVNIQDQSQLTRLILDVDSESDFRYNEIHDVAGLQNLKELTILSRCDARNWTETLKEV